MCSALYVFINSLHKYLLSTYYVYIVLSTRNITLNKTKITELTFGIGGCTNKKI